MVAIGGLRVDLFANVAEFREGLDKASGDLKRFSRRSKRTAKEFEGIGARLTLGITTPFVLFANQARTAARDADELQSAFDIAFGGMSDQANVWAETTGDAFGRSTQTLQEAGFQFQQLFRQAAPTEDAAFALSTAFAELASDAASFFNTTDDAALLRLRSGLAGEAEPLRRFGVFINEASVANEAFRLGIAEVGDELTDQQKILARASLIMTQLDQAQGDVIRTSDSLANQERALKEEFNELMVEIGRELMPVFKELVSVARDVLAAFRSLDPETRKTIVIVTSLAAAMGPVLIGLGSLIRLTGFAAAGLATLAARFGAAGMAAKSMTARIAGAAAAMPLAMEGGKALGDQLFKLTKQSDTASTALLQLPKWLNGAGLSADEARKRVKAYREEQERLANGLRAATAPPDSIARPGLNNDRPLLIRASEHLNDTKSDLSDIEKAAAETNSTISDLISSLGNMTVPETDDITSELDRVRGIVDPVGEAMEEYKADLEFARIAGLDMAESQRALGEAFIQSVGGVEAVRDSLVELPPVFTEIVEAADARQIAEDFAELREEIFPVQAALTEYEAKLRLAEQGGIDLGVAQRVLATDMIESLGGIDAVKSKLGELPPVFQEAAQGIRDSQLKEEMQALADQVNNRFDVEGNTAERLAQLKQLLDEGAISAKVYERAVKDIEDNGIVAFDGLARGLTDIVSRGADVEDTLKNVILEMLRAKAIAPFFDNLFGGGFGGDGGFSLGGIGSFFGGFLAGGGATVPGRSYIVGEEGPELFTPNMTGIVSSNEETQRRGDVINNWNIRTPDAGSFKNSRRNIQRLQKRGLENV